MILRLIALLYFLAVVGSLLIIIVMEQYNSDYPLVIQQEQGQ